MSGYEFLDSKEVEGCYKDYALRPNFGQFDPIWEGNDAKLNDLTVDQGLLDFILWCAAECPAITEKEIRDTDLYHLHNTLGILDDADVYTEFFTTDYSNLTNFFSIDLIKTKKRIFALLYTIGSLLSQIKEVPRTKGSEDTDYESIRSYFIKPQTREQRVETLHNFRWTSTSIQALGKETRRIGHMLSAFEEYIEKGKITTVPYDDADDKAEENQTTISKMELKRADRSTSLHVVTPTHERHTRGPGDFRPFPSFPPQTVECQSSGDPTDSPQNSHKSERSTYSYPTTASEANPLTHIRSANRKLDLQTMKILRRTAAVSHIKWDNVRSTFPQVREQFDGQLCIAGMSYIIYVPFLRDVREFKLATSTTIREKYRQRMALFLKKNHINSNQYREDRGVLYGALKVVFNNGAAKQFIKKYESRWACIAYLEVLQEYAFGGDIDVQREKYLGLIHSRFDPTTMSLLQWTDQYQTAYSELKDLGNNDDDDTQIANLLMYLRNPDGGTRDLIIHIDSTIRGRPDAFATACSYIRSQAAKDSAIDTTTATTMARQVATLPSTQDDLDVVFCQVAAQAMTSDTSLRIPPAIWNHPRFKQWQPEVNKIRKLLQLEDGSNKNNPVPGRQYSSPIVAANANTKEDDTDVDDQLHHLVASVTALYNEERNKFCINMTRSHHSDTFRAIITGDPYRRLANMSTQQNGHGRGASDSGADTSVIGTGGSHPAFRRHSVDEHRRASVMSWDSGAPPKHGLPIGSYDTILTSVNGERAIGRWNQAVENPHSTTTLCSEYQARSNGIVWDSVHKSHVASPDGRRGEQAFYLKPDFKVPLFMQNGLQTFNCAYPTDDDYKTLPVFNVTSPEPWHPQLYNDDIFAGVSCTIDSADDTFFDATTGSDEIWHHSSVFSVRNHSQHKTPEPERYFFDPSDTDLPNQNLGQTVDLSIDWTLASGSLLSETSVDDFLNTLDDNTLLARDVSRVQGLHTKHHLTEADAERLRPFLGFAPVERIRKTLLHTTQMAKAANVLPMLRHFAARFKWFRHRRLREIVCTDTVFSNILDLHGKSCFQVFFGATSRYLNIYGMNSKRHFPKAMKDLIRNEGIPSVIHSDNAREATSAQIDEIFRDHVIRRTTTEPNHPWQNPAETQIIGNAKSFVRFLLDRTGAPPFLWLYALQYFAYIHNRTSNDLLDGQTPYFVRWGETPDISPLLSFTWYEPVYYLESTETFPSTRERLGYWIGVADNVGDFLTYWILTADHQHVVARSVVRSAALGENRRVPLIPPAISSSHPPLVLGSTEVTATRVHQPIALDLNASNEVSAAPPHPGESLVSPSHPGESGESFTSNEVSATPPQESFVSPSNQGESGESYTSIPHRHVQDHDGGTAGDRATSRSGRSLRQPKRYLDAMAMAAFSLSHLFVNALSLDNCDPTLTEKGRNFCNNNPLPEIEQVLGIPPVLSTEESLKLQELQTLDHLNGDIDSNWTIRRILKAETSTTPRRIKTNGDNSGSKMKWTKGKHVRVKAQFTDGDIKWVSMEAVRLQDPTALAIYALEHNLIQSPGWKWCKDYICHGVERNDRRRAMATKTVGSPKYKFGIEIPTSPTHAYKLDRVNGDTLWRDATDTEIKQINDYTTFREPPDKFDWTGYKRVPYHFVYDCKFDLRRKARLVLNGNLTDHIDRDEIFSGVIGTEAVRLGFLAAEILGLECCVADIGNAFLNGRTREKLYIIAGPEFGPQLTGKRLIVYKSCYGLKTSAARFHEHLATKLRKMGFKPSRADSDLWMRHDGKGNYEYLATYIDDIAVFSKNPMAIIHELQKDYVLKGIGKPEYYLGGNINEIHEDSIWRKYGTRMSMSADTYIKNSLDRLQQLIGCGEFRKAKSPMSQEYHPETEDSNLLDASMASKYRGIIGSLNWIVTLGRLDIAYATNVLARYSMAPRIGHLNAAKRVLGYLREFPHGKIMMDPRPFDFAHLSHKINDFETWKEYYPDAKEELPEDIPFGNGSEAQITCFVDADHAHDVVTRRSVTGLILFVNQTPVKWFSKRQSTVETSTYGSELVAARLAMEAIIEMRYKLRMLGFEITGPSWLFGDNMSVILNTTMPSSMLKKKHHACSYHRCREIIAASIVRFLHCESSKNISDVMTKPLPPSTHHSLMKKVLFRTDPNKQCI